MNKTAIISLLVLGLFSARVIAEEDEEGGHPLFISVQPSSQTEGQTEVWKPPGMLEGAISSYLKEHKLLDWQFFTTTGPTDVVVTYAGDVQPKPGGGASVKLGIIARDPVRQKVLFFKQAEVTCSRPGKSGALDESWMKAAEKILPEVLAGLKQLQKDMRDNGTWFLVAMDKASDIQVAKVKQRLKREGHQFEPLPSGPGFFVRCKLDNTELAEQVEEAIGFALPTARFDFKARQRRIIKLEFRQ
jgi:hypothetical protein